MRRFFIFCATLALTIGAFGGVARAQFKNGGQAIEPRLPTLSQPPISTQRIGLTDITINHCRPRVGGREISGQAAPLGQPLPSGPQSHPPTSPTPPTPPHP